MPRQDVEVLAFGRSVCTPDWSYATSVFVDYARLYYFRRGSLTVGMENASHRLTAPRVYLLPGRCWVTGDCPREAELGWIHFRATDPGLDLMLSQSPRPLGWGRGAWRSWEYVIEKMPCSLAVTPDQSTTLLIRCMALYAVALAQQAWQDTLCTGPRAVALQRLQPTLSYMEANLRQPLEIGRLAHQAHVGSAQLNRLFRQALNTSPHQHLVELRMREARRLLRDTALPVQRIADEVGYCNAFYFSRAFRQFHGQSPRQYRQAQPGSVP